MRHSSSRSSADRHGNALGRTIVESVDDTKLMQESKHSLLMGEQQDKIELAHDYGIVSVVKPPTGSGDQRMGAEAFMSNMGSGRSHGIAVKVGDRRYRLYKLENGEVALHDDQGQQVHFKRDGIWGSVPNSKKIVMQVMDDDQMPQDSGAKGGQIKQAGRPSSNNFTLDKNSLTVHHTTLISLNAPTINLVGNCHVGGTGGVPCSMQGSIDTDGDSEVANLATKVWIT